MQRTAMWRLISAFLVLGSSLSISLAEHDAAGVEVEEYKVEKGFEGNRAVDLSGIACVPLNDGQYRCLVVNDESKFAQFAKIEDGAIEAKGKVRLIEKENDPKPLGQRPSVGCPKGEANFAEFDGEGVAYAAPYFYVVGRMAVRAKLASSGSRLSSSPAFVSITKAGPSMPTAMSSTRTTWRWPSSRPLTGSPTYFGVRTRWAHPSARVSTRIPTASISRALRSMATAFS
jgi:hypothetical protein